MFNARRVEKRWKVWAVVLSRTEMLDDIKNTNWIQSNATITEDGRKRSLVQEIDEDANRDRVVRVMDLAFGEVRAHLYKHLAEASDYNMTRSDDFRVRPDYVMRLQVPTKAKDMILEYVKDQTHEFILCRVLEDWLMLHGQTEQAGVWAAKAEDIKVKMEEAMGKARVNIVQVVPMAFG